MVLETLREGTCHDGVSQEILTDNGPQYVTWRGKSRFTRELEKLGIRQSVWRPTRWSWPSTSFVLRGFTSRVKWMATRLAFMASGSKRAKIRLEMILKTRMGEPTVEEACQRLGIGESRFHALRNQWLQEALELLEPRALEAVTKLVAAGLVPARAGHKGLGYRRRCSLGPKTDGGFVTASKPLCGSGGMTGKT